MTKDQLKAKYSRIANDDSQLTAFKDDLIDGEIPVNDARIPQPEAADANKLLIVDDEDNFVLSTVANAIGGTVQEMIADKADLVDGKVPSSQLPSYVDDVVEYASLSNFPAEGEQGKIYLAIDTGLCYRWSGSEYIQIAGSTAVLMFASQSNFPTEGEEGVIYVAEDTNKQFRWNGTTYVELSTADCIEVVVYQNTTPLTDAQIAKAREGKLAIYESNQSNSSRLYILLYDYVEAGHDKQTYSCRLWIDNLSSSHNVIGNESIEMRTREITLDLDTKMMSFGGANDRYVVVSNNNNAIAALTVPDAAGKQIVRALNLRKTQDMIADVYDATTTYAVGDYCIYQNDLYVCNTAISTAEAWTSSHWTKTNVVKAANTGKLPYLTTAPTADNTSGFISIVVLDAEPATRYEGYLYIITASAA